MCSSKTPISIGFNADTSRTPLLNPVFSVDAHRNSKDMWRHIGKQVASRGPPKHCRSSSLSAASSFLGFGKGSDFPEKSGYRRLLELNSHSSDGFPSVGFQRNCVIDGGGKFLPLSRRNQAVSYGFCCRSYASAAEAVEVEEAAAPPAAERGEERVREEVKGDNSVHASVPDEVRELLSAMRKEETRAYNMRWRHQRNAKMVKKIGNERYYALKKRQVKIETEAWQDAAKEYMELLNDMCAKNLAPNLPYMKTLFLGWFEPFRNKIAEEQELIREGKSRTGYAKYFDLLPAEMMAVITMHKLMGLLMSGGEHGCTRVVHASCSIGDAIEQEVRINYFLNKTKKKKVDKDAKRAGSGSDVNTAVQEMMQEKVTTLMGKKNLRAVRQIVNRHLESQPWAKDAKAKVGSRLIELMLQTAYLQPPANQLADSPPDIRPAFVHTVRTVSKENSYSRRYGVIECDPLIRKGLEGTVRHMVIPYMPMLVPPVRWTGFDKGAYLYLPSFVMRTHGARQQRDTVKRTPKEQLKPVFEALDTLGSVKWRVNKKVLDVVDRLWASGGRLGDMVDRSDIPLPEELDTEDESEIRNWKWQVKTVKKENSERHSLRCDTELKLAVARRLKEEEGFFYPHNLDFRGRAYPMHPHLNHLGSDICRGILEFSEGRPLGKSGLRWLKIHLANLYANGVDKLSHEGRLAFTENHMEDIFDSADRPIEGKCWWLKAEDPFQCLAACMNLAEALRSPFPEATISHIPVHQDGSCNGLQHYAALGRDKPGAATVNLVSGEKPADVYSGIAARVLEIMKEDALKDPEVYTEAVHARRLINQVDRKLVKQTVMTSVYGVTYIGARDQIKKRLKEREAIGNDKEIFGAACYAAKVTLTALGQMFEAARSIMSWLGECAKVIASENEPVRWTTPLGLPVVQPYRKVGRHLVKTHLQVLTLQRDTETIMGKKQRTAFPPNFVHSLDGSHMMMTAIACRKAGMNFAGVHDSYWTHACDVDVMNRILREKFVELYETPILENLLDSFQQSFPSLPFPPLPERGDFDLREVLESPYFFN